MKCYHPIIIKTGYDSYGFPKYDRVPCGKCMPCLQKKSNEWSFRIDKEMKFNAITFFVTLTYNDENVPIKRGYLALKKRDIQLFNKRLRKQLDERFGIKARFFLCGEYGPKTLRPHYHGLYFLDGSLPLATFKKVVERCWTLGFSVVKTATPGAGSYVSKYVSNFVLPADFPTELERPFRLQSRRPGIGFDWSQDPKVQYSFNESKSRVITLPGGYRLGLPRYYKDKIFSIDDCELREHWEREDYERELQMIKDLEVSYYNGTESEVRKKYGLFLDYDHYCNYCNNIINKLKQKGKL